MVLAPSSISSLPPITHKPTLPMTTSPFLMSYDSPLLKPSEWNKQKEAERSAHLEDEDPCMILIAHCELCDIGIGPGHLEQDLYLYPVYDQAILCIVNGREQVIKKEKVQEQGGLWFLCCGSCARSSKRMLPPSYILCSQVNTLAEARAMIRAKLAWFLMVTMVRLSLPLRALWGRSPLVPQTYTQRAPQRSFAYAGMSLMAPSTPIYAH